MKKVICIALIVLSIFSITACAKKQSEVNVPVKDIMTKIEEEVDTLSGLLEIDLNEEMPEINKQIIEGYSLKLEDIDEGIIKCPMINLQAEEVIILKATEESKVAGLKEVLENHVEKQLKAFENYVPKNYDLVNNHILKSEGRYILLVISNEGEKVEEIFDSIFNSK